MYHKNYNILAILNIHREYSTLVSNKYFLMIHRNSFIFGQTNSNSHYNNNLAYGALFEMYMLHVELLIWNTWPFSKIRLLILNVKFGVNLITYFTANSGEITCVHSSCAPNSIRIDFFSKLNAMPSISKIIQFKLSICNKIIVNWNHIEKFPSLN